MHMFAFVVLDLVFQYLAKRLAGKNISKMTYFVLMACKALWAGFSTAD